MNLNRILIAGRLTRDIELKRTPSDQAVATIGLAVNRKFKTKAGESREEVCFIDCEVWGRTAEVMSQHLSKGSPVFVEGRLKLDQWQDQGGQKRSKLKVVIESFEFVESKGQATSAAAGARSSGPSDEKDIPFG